MLLLNKVVRFIYNNAEVGRHAPVGRIVRYQHICLESFSLERAAQAVLGRERKCLEKSAGWESVWGGEAMTAKL